jgi:hypothetical protein
VAEVFLATHVNGVFRMSFGGFGPAELRIVVAIGALALLNDPQVVVVGLGRFQLFDLGGVVATFGQALTFVISAVRNGRALYAAERIDR